METGPATVVTVINVAAMVVQVLDRFCVPQVASHHKRCSPLRILSINVVSGLLEVINDLQLVASNRKQQGGSAKLCIPSVDPVHWQRFREILDVDPGVLDILHLPQVPRFDSIKKRGA